MNETVSFPSTSGLRIVMLGIVSAALFSVTFILNRSMSLEGGHWVWSALLRYVFTVLMLAAWIAVARGPARLLAVCRQFRDRCGFWLLAGGIGAGVFYAGICFAADHAPGWIVAATWQTTILASPIVLRAFGKRVPRRGIAFLLLIFSGIVILNAQRLWHGIPLDQVLLSVVPVLVAAFAYPIGNQLVNRVRHGGGTAAAIVADPIAAVFLLSVGSLPVFLALVAITTPPPPTTGQYLSTFLVALSSGCLATTLFLYARNLSADPMKIATADASQSGEVVFALVGEVLLLGGSLPNPSEWIGLAAIVAGLIGFAMQRDPTPRPAGAPD